MIVVPNVPGRMNPKNRVARCWKNIGLGGLREILQFRVQFPTLWEEIRFLAVRAKTGAILNDACQHAMPINIENLSRTDSDKY